MKFFKLGICVFTFLLSHTGVSQPNCDLKKDDDGILVSLCDSEKSNFKTIIVELDVPATLSQYAALALDVTQYHTWQYKSINPRIVGQLSKTELYYYSQVQTPWPTANRDMIWHMNLHQNPSTKVIVLDLVAVPDYLPEVKGVVRIPQAHSVLTVTPIDKGNVHVHYKIDVDPGGSIPAWVTNMFAALAPWHTYNDIRERIKAQGNDRITVSFIEDY